AGDLGSLTIGALLMSVVGFLPAYVQAVMGRSAAVAGFVVAALSVAWSCGSIAGGRLMVQTSYRLTGGAGALLLAAGAAFLITLDPHDGLAAMTAGALLIGIGMGVCNVVFLVAVQGSVGWNERGIATASTLFSRTIGQTIGAGLAGALPQFCIFPPAPRFCGGLDLLLEPPPRESSDPPSVARLR